MALDEVTKLIKHDNPLVEGILNEKHSFLNLDEDMNIGLSMQSDLENIMMWDGAINIEGQEGALVGVARKLNAVESPLKLAGNFGTKHNSCLAFAHQYESVVVVRSDDEHLKGITVFSHAALNLEQPECYHITTAGQESGLDKLELFRHELRKGAEEKQTPGGLRHTHTPLEYVSLDDPEKGIRIPSTIERRVLQNVVETSVQVCGQEGVWQEGVFMILARGEGGGARPSPNTDTRAHAHARGTMTPTPRPRVHDHSYTTATART